MKTVIYHSADFDGIFCREVARKFLGDSCNFIGWNYGHPVPEGLKRDGDDIYLLDISIDEIMHWSNIVWIDHHISAINKYPSSIRGFRMDGVAACRLAYQFFTGNFPALTDFKKRILTEPLALVYVGEYDIWDKHDPNTDIFQCGLRGLELSTKDFQDLLNYYNQNIKLLQKIWDIGAAIKFYKESQDASIAKSSCFEFKWEGLNFIALNTARCNSLSFASAVKPEHDACMGFHYDGKLWRVSLYGVEHKKDIDLSKIATKYGGGGHKQACGFTCKVLPFNIN